MFTPSHILLVFSRLLTTTDINMSKKRERERDREIGGRKRVREREGYIYRDGVRKEK